MPSGQSYAAVLCTTLLAEATATGKNACGRISTHQPRHLHAEG